MNKLLLTKIIVISVLVLAALSLLLIVFTAKNQPGTFLETVQFFSELLAPFVGLSIAVALFKDINSLLKLLLVMGICVFLVVLPLSIMGNWLIYWWGNYSLIASIILGVIMIIWFFRIPDIASSTSVAAKSEKSNASSSGFGGRPTAVWSIFILSLLISIMTLVLSISLLFDKKISLLTLVVLFVLITPQFVFAYLFYQLRKSSLNWLYGTLVISILSLSLTVIVSQAIWIFIVRNYVVKKPELFK